MRFARDGHPTYWYDDALQCWMRTREYGFIPTETRSEMLAHHTPEQGRARLQELGFTRID